MMPQMMPPQYPMQSDQPSNNYQIEELKLKLIERQKIEDEKNDQIQRLKDDMETLHNSQKSTLELESKNYSSKEHLNSIQITNLERTNKDLNIKIDDLQKKINFINLMDKTDLGCEVKINAMKVDLDKKVNEINNSVKTTTDNYIQLLFNTLLKSQLISQNEIDNIKLKIIKKEVDARTIISYLEDKVNLSKTIFTPVSDNIFNHSKNSYDDIFNKKWTVPLPRPPVCISEDPIKIKQNDNFSSSFSNY